MSSNYIFDKDDIRFRKKKTSVWAVVRGILMFFVASASMAVLYYVIFSLIFSTEEEKRLRQENRMYAREYPELEKKEKMLSEETMSKIYFADTPEELLDMLEE